MLSNIYANYITKGISNIQMSEIEIKIVDFNSNFSDLKKIRTAVFIEEQKVPPELEWDDFDNDATHFLAYSNNEPVGTARLLSSGHIGRMAILKGYRNRKIGQNMLKYVIEIAKNKSFSQIELSAQEHAVGFYIKQGFVIISDTYLDAGIPHYDMKYTH